MQAGPGQCATRVEGSESCIAAAGGILEYGSKIVCAASVCRPVEVARRVLDQTPNGIGSVRTTHEGVQHGLEAAVEIQCVDGSVSVRAAAAVVPQMLPLFRRGVANGVPPSAPPLNV